MNNVIHPTLVAGNPHCHRATFTRFILPFKWSLSSFSSLDRARPFFRPARQTDWLHAATATKSFDQPHLDLQRRRYVTKETESLLFETASWFVLESTEPARTPWREFLVESDLKSPAYKVALRHPALVLFECSPRSVRENNTDDADAQLLRNGFLIHEAYFPETAPSFADLLRFNEIFRYWRGPNREHERYCAPELKSIAKGVRAAKDCDGERPLYAAQWEDLMSIPVELMPGKAFAPIAPAETTLTTPDCMINPDDRAFTMPFAVVDGVKSVAPPEKQESQDGSPLCRSFLPAATAVPPRATPGYWVKLLNVDRPKLDENDRVDNLGLATDFEAEWADRRTYKRWAHDNSLYGFCEHSFAAMVSATFKDGSTPIHGEPPVALHFGKMYFDVTLLLLYLRVTVMRFSQRLHAITRTAEGESTTSREILRWERDFHKVRWQFLLLENLYQFPLLSNQQQHLEMYTLHREWMNIKDLYTEIDKEVRSSDEFLDNEMDKQRNELATRLNWVAAVGLGLSVALTCYQITGFKAWIEICFTKVARKDTDPLNIWVPIAWSVICVFLFLLLPWAISRIWPAIARFLRSSFTSKKQ